MNPSPLLIILLIREILLGQELPVSLLPSYALVQLSLRELLNLHQMREGAKCYKLEVIWYMQAIDVCSVHVVVPDDTNSHDFGQIVKNDEALQPSTFNDEGFELSG